jgi:hypothetical protein
MSEEVPHALTKWEMGRRRKREREVRGTEGEGDRRKSRSETQYSVEMRVKNTFAVPELEWMG